MTVPQVAGAAAAHGDASKIKAAGEAALRPASARSSRSTYEALADARFATGELGRISGSQKPSPDGSHMPYITTPSERDGRMSMCSTYSAAARASLISQPELLGMRRPRPHKIWKKKFIKLLVVGDSGLGKTTLIRSLMSTPGEKLQVHDGSFTPSEQFRKDPDSLCSTISWRDDDDRVIWVFKTQDTPGYGDTLDLNVSIGNVVQYIEAQDEKWLAMEQSRERKEDMSELEDPRVDMCIFCIGPHRLRPSDLKFMSEIGRLVPIVPVVTKADTMTIREAAMYRAEVANKIANPMLPGIRDKINVFHFERDTLARAGIPDSGTPMPPFLVVASNEINEELNSGDPPLYWPERRYPWGTAEAFNKDHSDLLSLRSLLLKEALEEVSKSKRSRYETWRRGQLRARSGGLGRVLRRAVIFTLVPAVVALKIGRSGVKVDDVKRCTRAVVERVQDLAKRAPRLTRRQVRMPEEVEQAVAPPPTAKANRGWL